MEKHIKWGSHYIVLIKLIKNILKKTDFLGKETSSNKGFQLHIYDDGSVEKKYLIK